MKKIIVITALLFAKALCANQAELAAEDRSRLIPVPLDIKTVLIAHVRANYNDAYAHLCTKSKELELAKSVKGSNVIALEAEVLVAQQVFEKSQVHYAALQDLLAKD